MLQSLIEEARSQMSPPQLRNLLVEMVSITMTPGAASPASGVIDSKPYQLFGWLRSGESSPYPSFKKYPELRQAFLRTSPDEHLEAIRAVAPDFIPASADLEWGRGPIITFG